MSNKKGLLALSPLFLLIVLIVAFTVYSVDSSLQDTSLSLTVAFMISSIYAVAISGGMPVRKRVDTYSKGAGANNLMLMLWIYVLAGSFAASAKAMGAVDATVNLALSILPASMILPGLFLAACFISVSIGTSVGTVVALVPIAAGLAHSMDANVGMMTAIIVGGAYFGDNLSFISDTTIAACSTQGCEMKDKFRTNFRIALPAALVTLALIIVFSLKSDIGAVEISEYHLLQTVPYLLVLVGGVAGVNVFLVLLTGVFSGAIIVLATGAVHPTELLGNMGSGASGMFETIMVTILVSAMCGLIREYGGFEALLGFIRRIFHGNKGGQLGIGLLVGAMDIATANNTVAIVMAGPIAKQMSEEYGITGKKSASLLDTFSCIFQGIIPYGAQMLLSISAVSELGETLTAFQIIPFLFYPFLLLISSLVFIFLVPERKAAGH